MILSAKIVALHKALAKAQLPHAFGGALALAWCTQRARGTIDIDLNAFVTIDHADLLLRALPKPITWQPKDARALRGEGQIRMWWDKTPVDLFLNTTELHEDLVNRIRWEKFAGQMIPFVSCTDLAIFKAFFNRTKDWADLEEMHSAGTLNAGRVIAAVAQHLGAADERVARLQAIAKSPQ